MTLTNRNRHKVYLVTAARENLKLSLTTVMVSDLNNLIWSDCVKFKDCTMGEEFIEFFDNDKPGFSHTEYYHYTTLEKANSILDSKKLWLTPLSESANDLVERETYKRIGRRCFSACFSTGTSENLPLWYLYSGVDGRGARIGFNKRCFRKLLNSAAFLLSEYDSKERKLIGKPVPLNQEDFKFVCRDILYIGSDSKNKNAFRFKYNGETINNRSGLERDEIFQKYEKFIKGLIWFYEKETRIQVEIINEDLLVDSKQYVVLLDLSDVLQDISIRLAPEFEEVTADLIESYKGLKEWTLAQIQKSEFGGQIKMNLKERLCKECRINKKETKEGETK